jgi:hypothetical protein
MLKDEATSFDMRLDGIEYGKAVQQAIVNGLL